MYITKKLALPEKLVLLRRKGCCGLALWVGISVIAVVLLSNSLRLPLFRGFNGLSLYNASLISWPLSLSTPYFSPPSPSLRSTNNASSSTQGTVFGVLLGNTHSGNVTQEAKGGSFNATHDVKDGNLEVFSGEVSVLNQTHFGNFTIEGKDGSFNVTHEAKNHNSPDFRGEDRVLNKTHFGYFSDIVSNGTTLPGEAVSIENFSHSGNASVDFDVIKKSSTGQESAENNGDVNSTLSVLDSSTKEGSIGNGEKILENQSIDFRKDCDIFDGKWVWDDSKPLYTPGSCPHIDRDFDCHRNRRPDDNFVKWKWQPNGCDIPSFNATDFLERLRGQKLVFVGDSLNRNMWESLVCILRDSIPNKKHVYEISGRTEFKKKGFYAFSFEDYNCTVDFVGSPFLVRESFFKGTNGTIETLRLDLMDKTTSMYNDADIIVFNTGHWWTHEKTSKGEDYYQEGNHVYPRLKVLEAYKRAIMTWARWVDNNLDSKRTQVFFRGYSVTHFRGGQWNSGGQCHKETEPIFNTTYLVKYPSKMKAFEHVLENMKTPVQYLNISRLTDYRRDGHPSIYRMQYKSDEERNNAVHSQDCSHWCLPGVPDTWNELLYASLLKAGKGSWRI